MLLSEMYLHEIDVKFIKEHPHLVVSQISLESSFNF